MLSQRVFASTRRFTTSAAVFNREKYGTLMGLLQNSNRDHRESSKAADTSLLHNHKIGEKVILPPRTGAYVGRSVPVNSPQLLGNAIRQINALNSQNKVMQTKRLQRFAERPGKAKLRINIERKRREFQAGIRRLFDLVNEARRKGY